MQHTTWDCLYYRHSKILNVQCLIIPIGFMAVTAIALHVLEWIPLHISAPFTVAPLVIITISMGFNFPELGRIMVKGWLFGILAVALYDFSRLPFIIAGWSDFIPQIGCWIFNTDSAPGICGYVWRYLGNGGGMGMSFLLLVVTFKPSKILLKGVLYGLFIFSCLMLTLLLAPNGENLMFELRPLTFMGSLIGHIIYGLVLGYASQRFLHK